ncbi:hypothetical protein JOF56_010683 [Kibdelosporangium banguiense]|uniref:Mucin-1 n=1 Tax=Kibdelosporangium banguiense TaxID=1365924 RepID=A0ABS4U0V9_9PSEU|nr:DUF5565 family protein [Kibdelosporangium banguiense]MBP2330298.1 hypothetical protein [Kibdelosporangium banguiense]
MRKIPTLFTRDPENLRKVTRDVHPDCGWVLDGEGEPTRKYDGTCVRLDESGTWWARREVKAGKTAPQGFQAVQQDPATGKTVGWEPAGLSPFAKVFDQAIAGEPDLPAGTYELCGPKVNGNPEGYEGHRLVRHETAEVLADVPRDYDGLMAWLLDHPQYEGLVWHHPDGRMAKLKYRDALASK